MTIAVNIKVNDGVVLATDSASTLIRTSPDAPPEVVKVFANANKVFNLDKRLPVGAITYGAGSIGQISMERLAKDFRRHISNIPPLPSHAAVIQPEEYKVEEIATQFKNFVYDERYVPAFADSAKKPSVGFVVAGYSTGQDQAEEWRIQIDEAGECHGPHRLREAHQTGITWNGQPEALNRLFFGLSPAIPDILIRHGLSKEQVGKILADCRAELSANLVYAAMPIQDAIHLAEFLVETAKNFSHFLPGAETVGGPTDIAAITKHEGFKWIKRKHYYAMDLNPGL